MRSGWSKHWMAYWPECTHEATRLGSDRVGDTFRARLRGGDMYSTPLLLGHPLRRVSVMTTDPHAALRDRVLQRVLQGAGESDPAIRAAAAEGTGLPADLQPLVDKVHAHAYKVTDGDVARPQATYGDDRMFEIIVSAALGASRKRLLAGLNALNET